MLSLLLLQPAFAQETLTLYTNREAGLITPMLEKFTAQTGVKVQTLFINAGLVERLQLEGASSPADVVIVTDVSTAELARERALTAPLPASLLALTPKFTQDETGQWIGLSLRSRVIYASKERVKEDNISYENLADPKWKGKVCIRQGAHPYNTSLFSAALAHFGEAKTESWLVALKDNLARKAAGGDRDVARDIFGGLCDIGIANFYYYGLMQQDDTQKKWADSIKVIYPKFEGGGTHVNLATGLIPVSSLKKELAAKLFAFMLTPDMQKFVETNQFETPVVGGVAPYTPDNITFKTLSAGRKAASLLVEKVGFDK